MFGGNVNPYDDVVAKTTDENLTAENWELILNLCDKVQDEGEQGARNVVAAVLKRLAHRNPNVQLYTLTLAEALTKNCGVQLHREIASRAFTQGIEKLIADRNTHDKVRRRALSLVALWTAEFEKDTTLGMMEELYDNLKGKGYKFEAPEEAPPPEVDDEVRRREEEELQRVLEMSMHDKGGRGQWGSYSLASSSGAGASSSRSSSSHAVNTTSGISSARPQNQPQQPTYGGYVPSQSPAVNAAVSSTPTPPPVSATSTYSAGSPASAKSSQQDHIPVITRVRALHTFEPTEAGELAFEKGDIIKVVDRGYKDWWRGQLKGRTGIFPVNYVEPLPEPTAAEIAKEAEREADVFNQAANVDKLLTMLRQMDPAKDNLADNEEIQELYRSCMSLRPKIVKLIDKYSQKRAELVLMNETFVKARTIFDRMMEDSLARHTGVYDGRPAYGQAQGFQPRPEPQARQDFPAQQPVGWNPAVYEQPGYNGYPAAQVAYAPGPESGYPAGPQPAPYAQVAQHSQSVYPHSPHYGTAAGAPVPYGPQPDGQGYPAGQPQQLQQYPGQQLHSQAQAPSPPQNEALPQPHTQQPAYAQPQTMPAQALPQQQLQQHAQPQPQTLPQQQLQQHAQPQPQTLPQQQLQQQTQTQAQAQAQVHEEQDPTPQQQAGPPYVYDPNTTYADPNVQAWAQYYAQGGTDPTGALYFISVPGVKEAPPAQAGEQEQSAQQLQPHAQQQSPQQGYQAYGAATQQVPGDAHAYAGQPAQDSSATSVNAQNGPGAPGAQAGTTPSSPVGQQSHYQASVHSNHSSASLPKQPVQQQPVTYGSSPYGPAPANYGAAGPGDAPAQAPASGDPNAQWHAQYYNNLPNQFSGMDVSGEGRQGAHPGQLQGVGAPA